MSSSIAAGEDDLLFCCFYFLCLLMYKTPNFSCILRNIIMTGEPVHTASKERMALDMSYLVPMQTISY